MRPLALNQTGPQDGGNATFEFFASPQGTTLSEHVDGIPAARLRFKRVAHRFDDFAPVAASMQVDPAKHWSSKPFATRLVDVDSTDRVTLTADRLEVAHADGSQTDELIERMHVGRHPRRLVRNGPSRPLAGRVLRPQRRGAQCEVVSAEARVRNRRLCAARGDVVRSEFLRPRGDLERDAIGVGEVDRADIHVVVVLARHPPLAVVVIPHLGAIDAGPTQRGDTGIDLVGGTR